MILCKYSEMNNNLHFNLKTIRVLFNFSFITLLKKRPPFSQQIFCDVNLLQKSAFQIKGFDEIFC